MKKLLACLLALLMLLAMAGCDSIDDLGLQNGRDTDEPAADRDDDSSTAGKDAGDGASEEPAPGYPDEDGFAMGYLGDAMHTYFFDYTVNGARVTKTYGDYDAPEGKNLLVADVTVKNTGISSIVMYDTDFQAQWNDDADDAFAVPVEDGHGDGQLPAEYELAVQEERSGELVFEVPADQKDFSVSYLEYFDDDSTGDLFFVFFTAELDDAA